MNQAPKQAIVVANQLPSKASFAVTIDSKEQVYIPASISRICNLEVGIIYNAILVPNNHESGGKIPWLAVRVDLEDTEQEPTDEDVQRARDELLGIEYPVTSDQVNASIRALQEAWRRGMIVKLEAKEAPDAPVHVFWAATLDHI